MPNTSPLFEPSAQIESLLTAVALKPAASEGMRAMMQRESEFPSPLEAKLTGIALDPPGRDFADQVLDAYWSDEPRQQDALSSSSTDREVIIGSGFHAAVYAATRVLCGYPKPLVLERNERAGGTFAMTARPTFYLNSRNRAGSAGLAGDQRASLNYLPGAPIQAANVSMMEYQTNTDMAFVIRLALAQFADVVTNAKVLSVARDGTGVEIEIEDRDPLLAGRVIDARGLGDPNNQDVANGTTILTFPQFMQRMASRWPLRGVRRVAVIGGGDCCQVRRRVVPWHRAATVHGRRRTGQCGPHRPLLRRTADHLRRMAAGHSWQVPGHRSLPAAGPSRRAATDRVGSSGPASRATRHGTHRRSYL